MEIRTGEYYPRSSTETQGTVKSDSPISVKINKIKKFFKQFSLKLIPGRKEFKAEPQNPHSQTETYSASSGGRKANRLSVDILNIEGNRNSLDSATPSDQGDVSGLTPFESNRLSTAQNVLSSARIKKNLSPKEQKQYQRFTSIKTLIQANIKYIKSGKRLKKALKVINQVANIHPAEALALLNKLEENPTKITREKWGQKQISRTSQTVRAVLDEITNARIENYTKHLPIFLLKNLRIENTNTENTNTENTNMEKGVILAYGYPGLGISTHQLFADALLILKTSTATNCTHVQPILNFTKSWLEHGLYLADFADIKEELIEIASYAPQGSDLRQELEALIQLRNLESSQESQEADPRFLNKFERSLNQIFEKFQESKSDDNFKENYLHSLSKAQKLISKTLNKIFDSLQPRQYFQVEKAPLFSQFQAIIANFTHQNFDKYAFLLDVALRCYSKEQDAAAFTLYHALPQPGAYEDLKVEELNQSLSQMMREIESDLINTPSLATCQILHQMDYIQDNGRRSEVNLSVLILWSTFQKGIKPQSFTTI